MTSKNPFDNQDITTYTSKTFGKSVKQCREQLGILARELAKKVGMSPVYLSDIERGLRPAPRGVNSGIDYMSRLAKELRLTDSQLIVFEIMADISRMKETKIIDDYFRDNPSLFKLLLYAIEENWTDEQWKDLYDSKK